MKQTLNCCRPDRDTPELVCGYPLPCPFHTVTIDTASVPPTVTIPATISRAARPAMLGLLKEIANSLDPESIRVEGKPKRARARSK